MTRAVFLCIMRKFVIDETWITGETQSNSSSPSPFSQDIQNHIDNTIKKILEPKDTKPHLFPIGRTRVAEEIARITLQPLYAKSRVGSLSSDDVSSILTLLSSSHYEVTLVTLEFLEQIFLKCKDFGIPGNHVDIIVKELLRQVVEPTMKPRCLSQVN